MFLVQRRGRRLNAEHCNTKFDRFYPICYTDLEDTSDFGPGIIEGEGEEDFDASKAAAIDAGMSPELFCSLQVMSTFCPPCLKSPCVIKHNTLVFYRHLLKSWFSACRNCRFSSDPTVKTYWDAEPTCMQCKSNCIAYFFENDIEDLNSNDTTPSYQSCFACMSNDPKFAPDVAPYKAVSAYRSSLAWTTLRGACSNEVREFCDSHVVQSCFVPLQEAQCSQNVIDGRRQLGAIIAPASLSVMSERQRRLQLVDCTDLASLSCDARLNCQYGSELDDLVAYSWFSPNAIDNPCGYVVPMADTVAQERNYTCSGSMFINSETGFESVCLKYMVGDGNCDPGCNVPGCSFDGGDCTADATTCPCDPTWLGDGYCDISCNITLCDYDFGDCNQCAPDCPRAWQGDDKYAQVDLIRLTFLASLIIAHDSLLVDVTQHVMCPPAETTQLQSFQVASTQWLKISISLQQLMIRTHHVNTPMARPQKCLWLQRRELSPCHTATLSGVRSALCPWIVTAATSVRTPSSALLAASLRGSETSASSNYGVLPYWTNLFFPV
eukprot:SAG31_NODE_2620_length_5364_cov_27.556315_2_plen_551_part_00